MPPAAAPGDAGTVPNPPGSPAPTERPVVLEVLAPLPPATTGRAGWLGRIGLAAAGAVAAGALVAAASAWTVVESVGTRPPDPLWVTPVGAGHRDRPDVRPVQPARTFTEDAPASGPSGDATGPSQADAGQDGQDDSDQDDSGQDEQEQHGHGQDDGPGGVEDSDGPGDEQTDDQADDGHHDGSDDGSDDGDHDRSDSGSGDGSHGDSQGDSHGDSHGDSDGGSGGKGRG